MTATIRKQIQRSRLAHSGGKRLDLYLTKEEGETLEAFRVARGLRTATDAVKALIASAWTEEGEQQPGGVVAWPAP